ncbi:MAG: hypothetical protein HC830_14610, partial [Bacteroidetes bacterium]|nr:hypothetical protein [Bacteroidota bacterium]
MGARLAEDQQWRFPEDSFLSEKVEKCLIQFEDEYFHYHPGFNPVSLLKASLINIKGVK